ncbi:MAG: hypothetical protein KKD69_05340 [Euryarchaeota archaeon]|nr:hypothetical protein [Euryarchaeota archaeon]MCG2711664.1 hypothetical protein [Candidatus Omnitrophota bacterium]
MAVIGIIAMLSALNAYLLAASRVLQNVSFENRLPLLPDISKKGTPYIAIIISTAAGASLLLFSNHFQDHVQDLLSCEGGVCLSFLEFPASVPSILVINRE